MCERIPVLPGGVAFFYVKMRATRTKTNTSNGLLMAIVRPKDAKLIHKLAVEYQEDPCIIAGFLAEIGERILRVHGDQCPARLILGDDPVRRLWMAINRNLCDYTEDQDVYLSTRNGMLDSAKDDARAFGRDLSDWIGTLIRHGADVMMAGKPLASVTRGMEASLMIQSVVLSWRRDQVAAG